MSDLPGFQNLAGLSPIAMLQNAGAEVNGKAELKGEKEKCPLIVGQEATQMFSQRNNPYCELLSEIKIMKKFERSMF